MSTIVLVILAIFLPPIAMLLKVGVGKHFWINVVLALLVVTFPAAMLHALFIILRDS